MISGVVVVENMTGYCMKSRIWGVMVSVETPRVGNNVGTWVDANEHSAAEQYSFYAWDIWFTQYGAFPAWAVQKIQNQGR